MKRLILYIALTAVSSMPLSSFIPATPNPVVRTIAYRKPVEIALTNSKVPIVPVSAAITPPEPSKPAEAVKPAFDPNNQATWPVCGSNQYVRADNGQCADRAVPQPIAVAATPAVINPTPVVSYLTDHAAIMAAAGIAPSDYGYVDYIVSHESGWRVNAQEPYSGAYGLPQALPGSKMATAGADWQTNPVTQLVWANSYAVSRYGSWGAAYSYWVANHNW